MSFLQTHSKARLVPGYKSQRFVMTSEGNRSIEEDAPVLSFDDDTAYVCGDVAGAFVSGPDGAIVRQIGLNIPPVTEVMRGLAFPPTIAGAAYLRWQSGLKLAVQAKGRTFGVLVYLRQTVRTDQLAGWSEQASTLHCYVVNPQENPVLVEAEDKGLLLRGIFAASIRTRPEQADDLLKSLQGCDSELAEQLRKPTESELRQGVRHAVTPLLAAIIGS